MSSHLTLSHFDQRERVPVMTQRVSVQEISSVDTPYFDMDLSESSSSESESEESSIYIEILKTIKEEPENSQFDEIANTRQAEVNENQEDSAIKAVKKYDRVKIRGIYKDQKKGKEIKQEAKTRNDENIGLNSVFDNGESVIVKLEPEDENFDENSKNNFDDEIDSVPDEAEQTSDESNSNEVVDELCVANTETLVNLEGMRYNNFDKSITCLLCHHFHTSRSECKLYNPAIHTVINDAIAENGEKLYDYESLPHILRFADSEELLNGVKANVRINPLTRFGPLVAEEFMLYSLGFDSDVKHVWLTIEENDEFVAWSTDDNVQSNWFRYVKPAGNSRLANLLAVTLDKKLYLITLRHIAANEELLYWQDEHRDLARWSLLQARKGFVKQSCGLTRVKFRSWHNYRVHMILFHNFKSKGMRQNHNFYCHVCNGSFYRKESLIHHCQVDHGGIRPFKCPLCSKLIQRASMVRCHARECGHNADSVRFPCKECGKCFVRAFYLKRHIATVHLGLRDFTCEFCGLQFSTDRSVRRHITAVHNGEQPHICDKCGRQFSQSSNLKVHLLTHSGVKPFQCQEKDCVAGFTTKQCLQFHYMRLHNYNSQTMPDIQRSIPFTYEDHSLNVDSENVPDLKVSKPRKRRKIPNVKSEDDNSEWEFEIKGRSRRVRKRKGTKPRKFQNVCKLEEEMLKENDSSGSLIIDTDSEKERTENCFDKERNVGMRTRQRQYVRR